MCIRDRECPLSLADIHDVFGLQDFDRLAHRGAAYAEALHQFRLRRQFGTRFDGLLDDHLPEPVCNLLGKLACFSPVFHMVCYACLSLYFQMILSHFPRFHNRFA